MFYVYIWYIIETKEIIYAGKGKGNRYKVKKHNNLFNEMIKRFNCSSKIVKHFENEKEAFEYEYELINKLKEKKQCVCNIRKGGFGGTTSWWNEERKKIYSINNCMKSETQRDRMSKQNPMKDENIARIVGIKHRKPFYIGNKEFQTLEEASKFYDVTIQTVKYWLNQGHRKNEKCFYKNIKDNQQPIHENSDKSIVEGSTTNE